MSVLLSEMERYLALHERVKSELDHILDALNNLSNNLLSHSVLRPSVLKRLIEHVRQQLAEKYSNYELVITEVHDYYNIPVSSFDYMDGILGVFVPLFVRPSLQEPMCIYIYIYISNWRVYQQISVKPINLVKMDSSLFSFLTHFGII